MASLAVDPNGSKRIQVYVDGSRKTIRLGKIPKNQAQTILAHVEQLAAAQMDGSVPPPKTTQWLAGCSVKLRTRLAKQGLCTPATVVGKRTVGALLAAYEQSKFKGYQEGTKLTNKLTMDNLREFWSNDPDVGTITAGDADDFRNWLLHEKKQKNGKPLSESTVNKRCSIASKFFAYAASKEG